MAPGQAVSPWAYTDNATVQVTKDAIPNSTTDFDYTTTGAGLSNFRDEPPRMIAEVGHLRLRQILLQHDDVRLEALDLAAIHPVVAEAAEEEIGERVVAVSG